MIGKGYLPLVTDDLAGGDFEILDDKELDMGVTQKRHGRVVPVTEEEYLILAEQYGF